MGNHVCRDRIPDNTLLSSVEFTNDELNRHHPCPSVQVRFLYHAHQETVG